MKQDEKSKEMKQTEETARKAEEAQRQEELNRPDPFFARKSLEELSDEERQEYRNQEHAAMEQERVLDPVTNDRGDPYRDVRDTNQDGQYDYMEDQDSYELGI